MIKNLNTEELRYISNNYYFYLNVLKNLIHRTDRTECINILDFGCGAGNLLKIVEDSDIKCKICGMDVFTDEASFTKVKKKVPSAKILSIKPYENFDFGNQFDVIISNQVFEHIENLNDIYKHLSNILKPSGIMICGFPTEEIILEPHLKLPLIQRLNKKSKVLYYYLKVASFLNIGQFSKLKKSKKIKKINYLQNRLNYCKKNLFYHSKYNHQRLLNKYFSKISDISHLPINYLRTYKPHLINLN